MNNRIISTSLAVILALSIGLIGCTAEELLEHSLTISSTEGGLVTAPGEGTFTYDEGEKINLTAIPDEGYQFASWTGDVDEIADVEDATTTITIKDDYSIAANFAVKQYSLVIHSTEGGSVITPGEDAYTYDKDAVVSLVAVADEGYVFMDWTGDVSTIVDANAASTTLIMNGGYSITASFAKGILDWHDLDAIRDNLSGSYIIMNDLDATTAGYEELASATANEGKGWEPIGRLLADWSTFDIIDLVAPFTGSLDGQGYEIRDLFINRPDEDGAGLFSCVGVGGVIQDVGVVNATVSGDGYVGGLVGGNKGGTVSDSYVAGDVSGEWLVGGLVGGSCWGVTVGIMSNCYSSGSVIGGYSYVGGLVGGTWGTVSNSYSTGSVAGGGSVGGLAGGNWGTVRDSHSTGNVTGSGRVGGLVGWNHGATVSNSYSTGSVTGVAGVGGLVGGHWGGTVSNSYYTYDKVLINGRYMITIGALSNEDFEQWLDNGKFLDINERLSREDGYYLINDVNDFKSLLAFGQNSALKFRLTNDLDLVHEPDFYIPYLAGEFDGDGHKIANLSFSSDSISQVGLFGYLASGGVVTGVSAENVDITGQGIVGGLVGENDGSVNNSYSTGRLAGYWSVGGLVGWIGWNGGTVSNSYYNYEEVLINGKNVITIGALSDEDFGQWLANDKLLDVNERLSQEGDYHLINDVNDFKSLLAFGQHRALKFRLTNDLDLGSDPNFYIPYLGGEFDGNGHKISNLRLNFDSVGQVGLFGYLASGGKVSKVGVENVNITVTAGDEEVGGLVGSNHGAVGNCYAGGTVTGISWVGTLVGWNGLRGTVNSCYASGSVTGNWGVGGLVGWNTQGTVTYSYSTASVTCDQTLVGGLVGSNHGVVSNSCWDMQTSGQATSAGGTGKTTTEMKNIATFSGAGWNIIAVAGSSTRNPSYTWNIVDGQTYPFLSWQSVS